MQYYMYIPGKHLLELIDIEEEIQGLDGENVVPALLPVSLEHSMGSCYHMLTHTIRWTCVGHVTGHMTDHVTNIVLSLPTRGCFSLFFNW